LSDHSQIHRAKRAVEPQPFSLDTRAGRGRLFDRVAIIYAGE
jgi:hypothetical protein